LHVSTGLVNLRVWQLSCKLQKPPLSGCVYEVAVAGAMRRRTHAPMQSGASATSSKFTANECNACGCCCCCCWHLTCTSVPLCAAISAVMPLLCPAPSESHPCTQHPLAGAAVALCIAACPRSVQLLRQRTTPCQRRWPSLAGPSCCRCAPGALASPGSGRRALPHLGGSALTCSRPGTSE
jgi:hypothetical protein